MLGGFRLGFSIALVLACSACASFGQSPHGRAAKSEAIWSGVSGGYRWQWTTMDLSAARAAGGKAVFSARAFERRTSQQLKEQQIDPVDSYVECSIAPLSVVGSIASYERDYYWEGGAHPSGSTDYVSES